jgi:hypothetical protein
MEKTKGILLKIVAIAVLLSSIMTTNVSAQTNEESKYYMGADYSLKLENVGASSSASIPSTYGPDRSGSTVVATAHALTYPGSGKFTGVERVRVWSRENRASQYLDPDGTTANGYYLHSIETVRTIAGFRDKEYINNSYMLINAFEPAYSTTNESTLLEKFAYDLLGQIPFFPNGTVEALVNGINAGTTISRYTGDNIYVEFKNHSGLNNDLSDQYKYDQADAANHNVTSSVSAKFSYEHTAISKTNYPVDAYGRVMYRAQYIDIVDPRAVMVTVYGWSGLALVSHTINRT